MQLYLHHGLTCNENGRAFAAADVEPQFRLASGAHPIDTLEMQKGLKRPIVWLAGSARWILAERLD